MRCHPCCWYIWMIASYLAASSLACENFVVRLPAGTKSLGGGDLVEDNATLGCCRTAVSLKSSGRGSGGVPHPCAVSGWGVLPTLPIPITRNWSHVGGGGGRLVLNSCRHRCDQAAQTIVQRAMPRGVVREMSGLSHRITVGSVTGPSHPFALAPGSARRHVLPPRQTSILSARVEVCLADHTQGTKAHEPQNEPGTACWDACSALLRNWLCVPPFLAGVFDYEELRMLNRGHSNARSSCRLGCYLGSRLGHAVPCGCQLARRTPTVSLFHNAVCMNWVCPGGGHSLAHACHTAGCCRRGSGVHGIKHCSMALQFHVCKELGFASAGTEGLGLGCACSKCRLPGIPAPMCGGGRNPPPLRFHE